MENPAQKQRRLARFLETQQAQQADVGEIATRSPNQVARNEHDGDAFEDGDAISKNKLNKIKRKRAAMTTHDSNSNTCSYHSSPPPPKFRRTEIGELIILEPEQSRGSSSSSSSSAHSASLEKVGLFLVRSFVLSIYLVIWSFVLISMLYYFLPTILCHSAEPKDSALQQQQR